MNGLKNLALRGISLAVIIALGIAIFLAVGGQEGTARTDLSGLNITALSSASGQTMYAYADNGESGSVYHSTDGGLSWQMASQQLGRNVNALAVSESDSQVVYAGTIGGSAALEDNSLYISTDGGRRWSNTPLSLPANAQGNIPSVSSLAVDRAGTVYVGTDGQGIYRLTDQGTTMVALGEEFYGARVDQVLTQPEDIEHLYAVTTSGLFESEDAGSNWSQITALPEQAITLAVAPSNSQILYAGTPSMGAYRSTDGGERWESIGGGLGLMPGVALAVTHLEVDANNPKLVYATPSYMLGSSQIHEVPLGAFVSTDAGDSWKQVGTSDSTGQINSMLQTPERDGTVLLGTDQGVLRASQEGIAVTTSAELSPELDSGKEFGSASWDRVLIILLTLMAAAAVVAINPARLKLKS